MVLLQEFSSKLVPKKVDLKWSPFWVQISNLPLKSRTREIGMEIGSKLGKILEVDVPEKGVPWGRYLRVRIQMDVTRKLIWAKKISIENDEPRWVLFQYERLPNFCYLCGKLDTVNMNALKREKPTVGWKRKNTNMGLGCVQSR